MYKILYFLLITVVSLVYTQEWPAVAAVHYSTYDTEDPCTLNKQTTYVIYVRNEGNAVCKNLQVVNKIPDKMKFISATAPVPFKVEGNQVVFSKVTALKPGAKMIYRIVCKALQEGLAVNATLVSFGDGKKVFKQEEPTTVVKEGQKAAALHVGQYETEDPFYVTHKNRNTTYVISVRNEGTATCRNIQLKNKVSDKMQFVSAAGPTSFKVEDQNVVFSPVPTLEPGKTFTCKVTCKALKEGLAKNQVYLNFGSNKRTIYTEEATTIKEHEPFLGEGKLITDFILISNSKKYLETFSQKGVSSVNSSSNFPLTYPIENNSKPYLKIITKALANNKIEITTQYYNTIPLTVGSVLLKEKIFTINQWQQLVVPLEGQKNTFQKTYLRITPQLSKVEHPKEISQVPLVLDNFYFFDVEKQKLLATGKAKGEVIGIDVPNHGSFRFSLKKFPGAQMHGIAQNNNISIFTPPNWRYPSYKLVARNTIVPGGKYWIWFVKKQTKSKYVTIRARSLFSPIPKNKIEGIVTAVSKAGHLVMISVGRDKGVHKGYKFTVHRNNKYKGKIVVEHVYKDAAAARIIKDMTVKKIQKGDLINN